MSNYDAWKARAPGADELPPEPCCVCTGHKDAPPCSEECEDIVRAAEDVSRRTGLAERLGRQIHIAEQLIARYRAEEPNGGLREREASAQVDIWAALLEELIEDLAVTNPGLVVFLEAA